MSRLILLTGIAFALLAAPPPPVPLNENQTREYHKLCQQLVAPCCWKQTLSNHQSSAADQVRTQIARELAAGRSAAEIQSAIVDLYSERILAFRAEATQGQVLVIVPFVALGAGLILLVAYLRRQAIRQAARPVL